MGPKHQIEEHLAATCIAATEFCDAVGVLRDQGRDEIEVKTDDDAIHRRDAKRDEPTFDRMRLRGETDLGVHVTAIRVFKSAGICTFESRDPSTVWLVRLPRSTAASRCAREREPHAARDEE